MKGIEMDIEIPHQKVPVLDESDVLVCDADCAGIAAAINAAWPATSPKNDGLDEYRRVRDQIRTFVTSLPAPA